MRSNPIQIGMMSGRFSKSIDNKIQAFPHKTWEKEFKIAQECGICLIEWIFDTYPNNPIMNKNGIKKINFLCEQSDVSINAVCADYFMEKKLFQESQFEIEKNLQTLINLIQRCSDLGISILEIPLVDSSSLKSDDNKDQVFLNLQKILPIAEKNEVILTLETDLSPQSFKEFLLRFDHPYLKANYDTGNSASLGYSVVEELDMMGNWVENIHIKDRLYKGPTVPLGEGDTNFNSFFLRLSKLNYQGDLIIQGAREQNKERIKPVDTCKKYYNFLKQYVDKYL